MCSSGCLSQVTTSVLAIVRMISIFLPFLQMPQWIPLTYIALYTFFMTANNIGYAFCQFLQLTHSVRQIIVLTVDCCYWLNIVQCILGILASFLTMAKIFSKRKAKDKRSRGCWIVLLMNIPYCMSTVNFILSKTELAKYGYVYLSFVAVPCFTSMFNPLVIVFLNEEIRDFTRVLLTKGVVKSYAKRNSTRILSTTTFHNRVSKSKLELKDCKDVQNKL